MGKMLYGYIEPRYKKQPVRAKTATYQPPKASGPIREGADGWKNIPSVGNGVGNAPISMGKKYDDPDMAERELKAQQEIAYKRTCVAPVCNKGGLVYVTEGTDLTTLGRKV